VTYENLPVALGVIVVSMLIAAVPLVKSLRQKERGAAVGLVAVIACLLVPIALVLGLLRTFANRACMLEDAGVFEAYKRGFSFLMENFGPALILFLIQIGVSIGIGIAMLLPGILMALCCLLWPLLILIQGTIAAYFSTLWTLGWRRWTGQAIQATPEVL
jgi:hypothetical protein